MSENIGEKTNSEITQSQENPWDSLKNQPMSKTFQVAPGTTKEAEFKRLTGEDWPGKKYIAETYGVDDDGYDYPIETWIIRERTPNKESGKPSMEAPKPEKTPSDESKKTPDEEPDDKIISEEEWQKRLQNLGKETEEEFAGERNINGKTGKERSFVEFDLYPRMKGETPEEYGKRLRFMHQKTAEYLEREKNKGSEKEQTENKEATKESYYDKMMKKVKEHENLTEEHKKNLEDLLNRKFKDKDPEKDTAQQNKTKDKSEKQKELEAARQKELELARQKEREKAKAALIEERKKIDNRVAEIDEALEKDKKKPLIAVNADFTHDKKDLAHDLAERNLNDEISSAKGVKGFVKRLWKGTLFKKYYEQRYTREFMEGERAVKIDGEELDLNSLMERRKDGAISRFVMSVVEDSEQFIHKKAGEEITEADAELTAEIRGAVSRFAMAQNVPPEERKREFREELARIRAEHRDKNQQVDQAIFDNYEYVAEQAFERVSHGMAIEDVMEGFKVYNAKARDGARTEAHRDAIDKIVNKVEGSFLGRFIPAETMAAACGIASALTQTGVRAVAGAAGGVLASGAIAGLKERNRITEDRARMMRDTAEGMSYEDGDRKAGRRTEKYEARIGGTLYDMRPASELATNIEEAMKVEGEGRSDALLRAIAEARVRTDFSDSESKDLISYTSADKRGEERLRLDKSLIHAEKSLSEEGQKKLEVLKKQVYEEISESVDESDRDFKRMRTHMAAKKAGKTILIGAATFVISQEAMAAFDPGKLGILEKAGVLKTQNSEGAQETLLASLLRNPTRAVNVPNYHTETIENVSGDREIEIDAYEKAGYQKIETSPGWTEVKKEIVEVKPSESTAAIKMKVDGWADNGTSTPDGNEIRVRLSNGTMISRMHGNSTMGGKTLNYESLAAEGRVKAYMTIGGAKFELASKVNESGQLTWGENGIFTTTTGETIRGIGENGEPLYRFFQVAVDNGVDEDGVHHIISLATAGGKDSFSGTMQQIGEQVIEHPATYSFVKTTVTEVPRLATEAAAVTTAGIAFGPETARTGLGGPAGSIVDSESSNDNPNKPNDNTPSETEDDSSVSSAGSDQERGPAEDTPAEPLDDSEGATASSTEATGSSTSQGETQDDDEPLEFSDHTRGELRQFSQKMIDQIELSKELIGQEGVSILTDKSRLNSTTAGRYRSWWNSLNSEQKGKVAELIREINGSDMNHDLEWGGGFRTWFMINARV